MVGGRVGEDSGDGFLVGRVEGLGFPQPQNQESEEEGAGKEGQAAEKGGSCIGERASGERGARTSREGSEGSCASISSTSV